MKPRLEIGAAPLALDAVAAAAAGGWEAQLDGEARLAMEAGAAFVEAAVASGRKIYGITTGFGALQHVRIPAVDLARLQRNLLISHAVSVGEPLPAEIVRAMLLLRARSLAQGCSGVRPLLVERLLDFYRLDLVPEVPRLGSVGASGDLSPLSHMALPLIGEGRLLVRGAWTPAAEALAAAGLAPLELQAKEGLALNNGTQLMGAAGVLACARADSLARHADLALALSLEALEGRSAAFHPGIHRLRPHPGQVAVAANVRRLCAGSQRVDHGEGLGERVQDSYSVRCGPQVHGASRDAFAHVRAVVEREINSVTDNPLVFLDEQAVLSGGNFHGQPLALALDFLKLGLCELGSISERRTAKLLDASQNHGLPPFLVSRSGLNSGMMICQYTAAALVSKNKTLAHPDSVDSIPTSANQEDHVSMGANAALHALEIADNIRAVIAIELLAAHYGNGFRRGEPGRGCAAALARIAAELGEAAGGEHVEDHDFGAEVRALLDLVGDGGLLRAVEAEIGALE
jgi:histidine ammonia-lyase